MAIGDDGGSVKVRVSFGLARAILQLHVTRVPLLTATCVLFGGVGY